MSGGFEKGVDGCWGFDEDRVEAKRAKGKRLFQSGDYDNA
jgi:hypothetical protein